MTPTVSPEIKSACITIAPALGQDINLATAALEREASGSGLVPAVTCLGFLTGIIGSIQPKTVALLFSTQVT